MPIGMIFWMLMILWFVFGVWQHGPTIGTSPWPLTSHMLVFILLFLLGWAQFGFVVK